MKPSRPLYQLLVADIPPWKIWLEHQHDNLRSSFQRLMQRPWATILTSVVMALVLVMPMGLFVVVNNLKQVAQTVQHSRDINVFLKKETLLENAQQLAETLKQRDDVSQVVLQTPEQGLAELRQQVDMEAAIQSLQTNPLPILLMVTPKHTDDTALAEALQALSEVDWVQHDVVWRQRLDNWLSLGNRLVGMLSLLLGLAALFVVGNTVRLDIQSRKDEIHILQLLGASDAFIRQPFLYLGGLYGILAGVLLLVIIFICERALHLPLNNLATSYTTELTWQGLRFSHGVIVLATTLFVGVLGAGLITGHYLRQIRSIALK